MNWKEISIKYPNSYKKYIEYQCEEYADVITFDYNGSIKLHVEEYDEVVDYVESFEDSVKKRELYDFFDRYGVYCQVIPKIDLADRFWYMGYVFTQDDGTYVEEDKQTRPEIEKDMFLLAFEMMEEKISKWN